MDIEAAFQEDLNNKRPKVNQFEQIFDRMQAYKGVLGVTFVTNYKLFKTSLLPHKAEAMLDRWMPIVRHLERSFREHDITDGLVTLQVTCNDYEVVIGFGYADEDFKKMYAIIVQQSTEEPLVPKMPLVKKVQDSPKDPRDYIMNFNALLDFRKRMWKNSSSPIFDKDPMFFGDAGAWELEFLEEIHKTPEGRGLKKYGNEVKIFQEFLSRCRVSPPDPETGKSKWTYLEKPIPRDYHIPDVFTREMAKKFADTKEEVDIAAEGIEELIDKGALTGEERLKEDLKKQLEKQRNKILLSRMEQLKKKRFNKNWQKRCIIKYKS